MPHHTPRQSPPSTVTARVLSALVVLAFCVLAWWIIVLRTAPPPPPAPPAGLEVNPTKPVAPQ